MWKRILEIVRKEFRQALREPRMRVVLFLPPLLQLLIFGYAVNLDVEKGRIGWVDRDRTVASRELLEDFTASNRFEVVAAPVQDSRVRELLDHGDVQAVVVLLPGFASDLERGRTSKVQVLVDGSNSNTAAIISNYADSVVSAFNSHVFTDRMRNRLVGPTMQSGHAVSLSVATLSTRTRVWFNPDLRSRNYFVPGVIINIITLVTLMLTAMAIVREKEIGTMEQLMVTPIRPVELMIGKMLPFALIGLVDLAFVTIAAMAIFHIPFRGNPLVLLLSAMLFVLSTLGVGLFLSTIVQTQQQAIMAAFFFFNPAFMLSGFAFPIRNMPLFAQMLSYINPLRYFMQIVRDVFLKGTGVAALWPQMLALLVFGVAVMGMSSLRFRKRLD